MTEKRPFRTIGEALDANGVSRRSFLKFCMVTASMLALPPGMGRVMAQQLRQAKRPSVIYLSFQECTGCMESFTRSFSPSVENLIFNVISLDYQETIMAAAGHASEVARQQAMEDNWGEYLVVVDGSVPTADGGVYCTAAGKTAHQTLIETVEGAAAVVTVGTCAAFGGIPFASPNPTGARPISELVTDKPVVNVSGCPPIPEVITGTLVHYLTLGRVPDLDEQGRPLAFFGNSIHDRWNGWCLYELGCKGPTTYNACATVKWNDGTSFPIESGHGCLGCSEPNFWDKGSFYKPLAAGMYTSGEKIAAAAAAGAALGAGAAVASRLKRRKRLKESTGEEKT